MTFKKLVVVTLRSAPPASVDVPEHFPRVRGKPDEPKPIERSVVGALRMFPGVPKAVTSDELAYVETTRRDVAERLDVRPYRESKRKDHRGATEAEVREVAVAEGVEHLSARKQVEVLVDRGKLKPPKERRSVEPKSMKRSGRPPKPSKKPAKEPKPRG
jgi:hypothetical protein